jgi:flagellar L-ring protein FlgH
MGITGKIIRAGMLAAVLAGAGTWAQAESLSNPSGNLFSSERAYQEGDLITVIVSETSQGTQSASTDLDKETSMGLTTSGVVGAAVGSAGAGLTSKQKGGDNLARQGAMRAMITTKVEKVLPGGNVAINGVQEIEFDSGRQRISVRGVARPRDIDSANQVYSYRLADAQIEYLGSGALNEKARTGYISRFLEWLWIF